MISLSSNMSTYSPCNPMWNQCKISPLPVGTAMCQMPLVGGGGRVADVHNLWIGSLHYHLLLLLGSTRKCVKKSFIIRYFVPPKTDFKPCLFLCMPRSTKRTTSYVKTCSLEYKYCGILILYSFRMLFVLYGVWFQGWKFSEFQIQYFWLASCTASS